MKITTLILNCLTVCVGCLTSLVLTVASIKLACCLLEGKSLPGATIFCYNNIWILWAAPLVWGIATILFFIKKNTPEKINLHTSASIFLGLFLFFIYTVAAILPFLSIITCLGAHS